MKLASKLLCYLVTASVVGPLTKPAEAHDELAPGSDPGIGRSPPAISDDAYGNRPPCCQHGICPLERGAAPVRDRGTIPYTSPAHDGFSQTASAEFDLLALTLRLEFATEILVEEIEFEVGHDARAGRVLSTSQDLLSAATHLRSSVQGGSDGAHLAGDIQNVGLAFQQLDQIFDLHWTRLLARATDCVAHAISDLDTSLSESPVETQVEGPFLDPSNRAMPNAPQPTTVVPPEMKGIGELPPADQRLALEQQFCPVTQDLLGSMGKPIKVQVGEQSVFVCCEGCVDAVHNNPGRYLSRQ